MGQFKRIEWRAGLKIGWLISLLFNQICSSLFSSRTLSFTIHFLECLKHQRPPQDLLTQSAEVWPSIIFLNTPPGIIYSWSSDAQFNCGLNHSLERGRATTCCSSFQTVIKTTIELCTRASRMTLRFPLELIKSPSDIWDSQLTRFFLPPGIGGSVWREPRG